MVNGYELKFALPNYDPVKWTLDFHQFLVQNYKLVQKEFYTWMGSEIEHSDLRSSLNEDEIDERYDRFDDVAIDSILNSLLNNKLSFIDMSVSKIHCDVKNGLSKKIYLSWTKGKKSFYSKISTLGKKTDPADLRPIHLKDWAFLKRYYEHEFPRKVDYYFLFNEEDESAVLKSLVKLQLLFAGVCNSRDMAEILKNIDPKYSEDIANSEDYYLDLIENRFSPSLFRY